MTPAINGYTGKWSVDPKRDPTHFGFHIFLSEKDYAHRRQAIGLPPRPNTSRWFGEVDPHITQNSHNWPGVQT
ncbi:MAG: hypothetical protein R2932_35055 [Caldilineaceae bacterium]